jgi:iron complex outermembrane receptor protein
LSGAEFSIDLHPHPLDWLHFENSFSFVNGIRENAGSDDYNLPFIPAPKIVSELRGEFAKKGKIFGNPWFNITAEHNFQQDKIYELYDTESITPAYTLLHLGVGSALMKKEQVIAEISLHVSNLTDAAWQNHLSRLKYAPVNEATGRSGVYGMGRNFSIRLSVPLTLK